MIDQEKNNIYKPGKHLLLDFYGAKNLTDLNYIKRALISTADKCKATVLGVNFHSFGINKGITGVIILAESHISIHTWPEINFVALDVFMCGNCTATDAVEPLKQFFKPTKTIIKEIARGVINTKEKP